MKRKILNPDLVFDLVNAFKYIKSEKESAEFLADILTANEIKNLSNRLRIARLLLKGIPQRQITVTLHVSIATVTKVNSWLNQKGNGFKQIITKLPIKYNVPTKSIHGPIEFHLPEAVGGMIQYTIASKQNKQSSKLIDTMKSKHK
jgi:TrpR-related protein YerC/YecD